MLSFHTSTTVAPREDGYLTKEARPVVAQSHRPSSAQPTLTSDLSLFDDEALNRATDRAYREAARSWADYRKAPSGDVARMLLTSADAADEWFELLRDEQAFRVRVEPRSSDSYVVQGYADRQPVASPWVRNAQRQELPARVGGGRGGQDLAE